MLPRTLKYGSKVESAIARSSRINIAPQNGTSTYLLGDTIIINIPTSGSLCLASTESYLKFNVAVTSKAANNAFRWDSCGAHGLIQRIRVFSGSNLLQDIDNYGLLAKMLYDLQLSPDSMGKQTLLSGTRVDTVTQFQDIVDGTYPNATDLASSLVLVNQLKSIIKNGRVPSYQSNSGERIGGDRTALTANTGVVSETYCLNLISLVGSLSSSNYVPLFAMGGSSPLRIEIQLIDNFFKGCSDLSSTSAADSASIALTQVEYIANFIELGDQAMSVINASLEGQPLQYVFPDFRNYQYTQNMTTSQTLVTIPVPARFSSVKNLITSCRDKGAGAAGGFFPFSSVKLGLNSYSWRVGSQIMPPKAPSTNAEFFAETLKAMGSIADINYTPSIDKLSYTTAQSSASNDSATNVSSTNSSSFYIGLDLENYAGSPNKDTIFAGYNTNSSEIYLMADYNCPANINGVRWDTFANFDAVLVCENGNAYVKF